MLIPMCITDRRKAFRYAAVCTLFSVAGGLLGYAIGYYFYRTWGHDIIHFYGMDDKFDALKLKYDAWGGWILFLKGMTPVPYKILTILSGVMHLAIPTFIIASICGRAVRFYLVAGLLWKFGAPIQLFIEKYLVWVTFLFVLLLIGGFLALKYIL
jgi:membrane protein YqaA with SNARE-associated domain